MGMIKNTNKKNIRAPKKPHEQGIDEDTPFGLGRQRMGNKAMNTHTKAGKDDSCHHYQKTFEWVSLIIFR